MLLASWEVRELPEAAVSSARSQFFPIRTDPKPVNNVFILFSYGKLADKWVCYTTLSLNRLTRRLQTIRKNSNERVNQVLYEERGIKKQIYLELIYVRCI